MNGGATVLGSILAMLVAMNASFTVVLGLCWRRLRPAPGPGTAAAPAA